MQFYTYAYIMQHSHFNSYLQYALSFVALLALVILIIKYLRDRIVSKYRDLIVILILAIVFLGGMQWNDYSQTESDVRETSRMADFLHSVGTKLGVPDDDVRASSTHIKQGMLVEVHGVYYQVDFNTDFNAYNLKEVNLLHDKEILVQP